ncbi:MAG TPA: sigma-70 family RNA polymerase sigma factor [Gaiellaceae bacterium]|nr:sigma-70 family RNA polymerase sigma factor [Gaiellaceae bacterium]
MAATDAPTRDAEALFEEHSARIYRFCARRLGSPQEAEDALQVTYLNAWRSLKAGTCPHDAVPWLFQIASNVCATVLRNRSRRGTVELLPPADLELVASKEADNDELLGLTEALEALPERQRKALLLRDWRGFSYEEIAGALDASHPAVETLLFRARRAVAASLTKPVARARRVPVRSALSALLPWPSTFPAKAALTGGAGATKVAIAVGVGATAPLLAFGLVERALERERSQPPVHAAPPAVQAEAWPRTAVVPAGPATAKPTRPRSAAVSSPAKRPRRPVRSESRQDGAPTTESTTAGARGTTTGEGSEPGAASAPVSSNPPGPLPAEPSAPDPVPAGPAHSEAPPSESPEQAEPSGKVAVCHATGSKKNPAVTLQVASAAAGAHLSHGDQLGPCPS